MGVKGEVYMLSCEFFLIVFESVFCFSVYFGALTGTFQLVDVFLLGIVVV